MAGGQTSLPPDIHPESLSRLPPVQRADLDDEGQRIWDALAGTGKSIPRTGPSAATMHSPRAAEPIYALNQVMRKTVAGSRYFELAALARGARVRSTVRVADYAMAGFILTAVDQQLPPDRKPLLPPR